MAMRNTEQESEGIAAWQEGQEDFTLAERVDTKLEFLHDRWPLITDDYGHITLKTLCVAFQGIVFQQYELSTTGEAPLEYPHGLNLTTSQPILIRDSDFVDPGYEFNEDYISSQNYAHRLREDQLGFIVEHKGFLGHEETENPRSVALAVAMFVNGTIQQLKENEDHTISRIKPPNEKFKVEKSKSLQMTLAYKLLLPGEVWDGPNFPINLHSLCNMHRMLKKTSFTALKLSEDVYLNFVMRRNLEHILSVCSIPAPPTCHNDGKSSESAEDRIALTCGDMSGHRIVTSASL